MFQRLRVDSPPKAAPPAVDWIKIAPYVCVCLTIVSTILGGIMWRQIDQIGTATTLAAANKTSIDRIEADRTSRGARVDARFDGLDKRMSPIETMLKDIARLETFTSGLDTKLVQGREERLADTAKMVDSLNALKTEVALLRQSVEARGRSPDQSPFGGSQRWIVPPSIPLSPILKARATSSPPQVRVSRVRRAGKPRLVRVGFFSQRPYFKRRWH